MWDDLPPEVAAFSEELMGLGFTEKRREAGTMDSGLIVYRRAPVEIRLVKDRSFWSFDVTRDGWRDAVGYGFGLSSATGDGFPPRPDRDAARSYDVPGVIRWVIRRLLSAGFRDVTEPHGSTQLAFSLDEIKMRLEPVGEAWAAELRVEGWAAPLRLPGFHDQLDPETR